MQGKNYIYGVDELTGKEYRENEGTGGVEYLEAKVLVLARLNKVVVKDTVELQVICTLKDPHLIGDLSMLQGKHMELTLEHWDSRKNAPTIKDVSLDEKNQLPLFGGDEGVPQGEELSEDGESELSDGEEVDPAQEEDTTGPEWEDVPEDDPLFPEVV